MAKNSRSSNKWALIILVLGIALMCVYIFGGEGNPVQKILTDTVSEETVTSEVKGVQTETSVTPLPSSSGTWYEVYFTNPHIPFDDFYSGGIEQYLIQKIDSSQQSIDVAVFEFDIETVAQALIRAEKRGVDVHVVYDNEHTEGDPQMDELIAAGISAVPDNRSAFMHNKFFIFDNACVWTGSFNISMNAAYRNNENALYFCSPEAAKNYGTEFNEMFAGEFGPTSPSDTPYPEFKVDGIIVENYFASEDEVMDKIIKTVSTAQTSIHFMAYSFTDDDLANAMITDAGRGVIVEGVFETTGADTQYSECGTLLKKGYDIRLDGNPRTFHHKVIIIDGQTVILGSFNFSANADTQNDENLLIVHDPSLAAAYEQQYQLMKSQAFVLSGDTCSK